MMKRIGRYLRGGAPCAQDFHWSSEDEDLLGFADSDWAGSKRDATDVGISVAADFGKATSAKVHTDSTAALGMVFWPGLVRAIHFRMQYPMDPAESAGQRVVAEKVDEKENVADLMTKSLSAEVAT